MQNPRKRLQGRIGRRAQYVIGCTRPSRRARQKGAGATRRRANYNKNSVEKVIVMRRDCGGPRYWICLACAAVLQPALAQAPLAIASEQEFLADVPTVLSASRLLQPVSEVPVTMTVIDRATIEASGLRNITDLFRLVPGMYVRPGVGIEGVVPVVSYHGLTNEFARRMQVLVDGRSVYLPPFSTVLWDDLPLVVDDIDHIEVTRGPNAASDGANAFFGTINIVTRTPVAGEGGYALARSGSAGVHDYVVRDTGAEGRASYRMTLGHKADDGFVNLYDSQHHDTLSGRADIDIDAQHALQAQLGYGAGQRELGGTGDPINRPRTKNVQDSYLQLKWLRTITPNDELSVQYYYEQHSVSESEHTLAIALPGAPLQAYPLQADYRVDRHDLELVQTIEANAALRIVLGAGARVDQISAPVYFGGKDALASNLERLFVHAEWRATPAVLLQAGGMLEHDSTGGTDLSPRASASWRLDAQQNLRASVSRATRTPSLFEAQGGFVLHLGATPFAVQASAGNVHPEQIISTELGYHASRLEGALQVDLKAYRDHASGLIEETANPALPYLLGPTNFLQNLNDARVAGAEAELHYRAGAATRYVLAYANTVVSSTDASQRRTMPRNVLALLAQHRLGADWTAALAWYVNSGLPSQTGIFGQRDDAALGYQRRLDLHAGRPLRALGHKATVTAGVQNLGSGFVEFRPETTFTRRVYLDLSARL